ncbi:hypothetical protein [uncultured Microbacterium sp.]|uniref:hypothetical protein n=1 Tax=uncultured Microbacterium sp. TaxID=191216 RepID=UPI0028E73DC2|nr:hypothetical protein [uncultured Microbacterium sp.]
MTASLRTFSSLALGGVVLAAALSGCAMSAGTSPVPESTSAPDTSDTTYAPQAAWLDATSFVVKTWGDACAPQIGDIVAGDQSLELVLVDGTDEVCAAVQTAHGMYVGLPAAFDSSRPVELTVTDPGGETTELTLPGLVSGEIIPADRMPEQTPAATWMDAHELAVLTWGSSTCMPASGAVEAVSENEAIVRLEESANEVCTMDLVPQITFVTAVGIDQDAELTLDGYVDADGAPVVVTIAR